MDEYAQVYWLDERNAGRDHRTQGGGGGGRMPWRPGSSAGVRPAVVPPPVANYPAQPAYPAQPYYPAQPVYGYGQPVVMQQQPATFLGGLFGGLTIGQILEMLAQAVAALQPLPSPPVGTRDLEKDMGNLVLYQSAVAQHAKRDEQLRTIGSLVGKLVK